jgi:sugar O-acyltransferase (sialic acid O-acetyltransferase NeuD family)
MSDTKKMQKIFIWGAGGHGRMLLEIFKKNKDFEVAYFIDDNLSLEGKFIDGVRVLCGENALKEIKEAGIKMGIAGVGDCKKRCEIFETIKKEGFSLANAIDPTAIISPTAKIGEGVTIWSGAIVDAHSVISDNVIINEGAIISHDNIIGFGAHIASGVRLIGGAKIGEKTLIGMGAIIVCKEIGKNSAVGAGSVVSQDIIDNVIAVGFPARIVGKRD